MTTQTKYLLKDCEGYIWTGKLSPDGLLFGCSISNESVLNYQELCDVAHDYKTAVEILHQFQKMGEMARIFKVKPVPLKVNKDQADEVTYKRSKL